jgi:soluble lytic murein transglycosylase-like protein
MCLVAGTSVPVGAQIYSWQDESGVLVLSDRPRPGGETTVRVHTFEVPAAATVRTTLPAATDRARAYDGLIVEHANRHSVRTDLVRAVIQVESAFNPFAESPKGAQGLMQLMPATARRFGVANPFNPAENVRAGVAYLRELLDRYSGNERLALAAYNAGPGAVARYGESVPPYRETRNYVSKISDLAGATSRVQGTTIRKGVDVLPDGREIPLYTTVKR